MPETEKTLALLGVGFVAGAFVGTVFGIAARMNGWYPWWIVCLFVVPIMVWYLLQWRGVLHGRRPSSGQSVAESPALPPAEPTEPRTE